jgi:hypothetical protein
MAIKNGLAASYASKYTGRILVSFENGTAGITNPSPRMLKPKIVDNNTVVVRAFNGLWTVATSVWFVKHNGEPLRRPMANFTEPGFLSGQIILNGYEY